MKKSAWFCIIALALAPFAFAAEKEGVEVTIYNQNFGLVKDRRLLTLTAGINNIRFSDVAAMIEPPSVHFKSLTDPLGCVIQEQNYEFDLVSADRLLSKYVDKNIKIKAKDNMAYEGSLMSCDNTNVVILSSKDKTPVLVKNDNIQNIEFGSLPEGLITKPTLMWQISNNKAGEHLTEVSYLTKGLNWNADYVLISDKDDKSVDLSGWVTIDNRSGAGYKDASLKLIAGDVQRAEARGAARYEMMKMDVRAEPGFAEKAFFEYHMYTLQRRTTVKENQTKQISLLSASDIPVKKLFVYDPVDYYGWYWYHYDDQPSKEKKIKVKLELTNSKRSNLGMPLPRGKVKVYKKDSDGSLQFIGEDTIDHTPKDETIRLYLGEAFDVVGERKKTGYREDNSAQWAEESFEISLRNHKDSDIEVEVIEHLWRYVNWKIVKQSHQFTKKDATTVVFKIPVPKGGEVKVSYTVKYWW